MKPIIKKKIDTESKNYKLVRGAIDWAAFIGGCIAVDCVLVPYVEAFFGKRLRLFKYIGGLGIVGISTAAGCLAEGVIDEGVTAAVELHNMKVDEYEHGEAIYESEEAFARAVSGDYTVYTLDPRERLDKGVDEYHIFEFDTEEAAKEVGSKIVQVCYGGAKRTLSIAEYLTLRGENPKMIPYSDDFGWSDAGNLRPEIEKITNTCWILDLPKYDYINVVVSNPKED